MRENESYTPRSMDQVLGCMIGGAVGDALGYAVEFMSYDSIVKEYGERGITSYQLDRQGVAEISDDTQMSLFTAAGILLGMTRGQMRGIMGRIDTYCHWTYLDWLHTQEWKSRHEDARVDSWLMDVPELYAQRAPGNTCLSALRSLEAGKEVRNNSCGCGGFRKLFRRRTKERSTAIFGRTRSGSRAGSSGRRWSLPLRTSKTTMPSNPSAEVGRGMRRSRSLSTAPPGTGTHSKMQSQAASTTPGTATPPEPSAAISWVLFSAAVRFRHVSLTAWSSGMSSKRLPPTCIPGASSANTIPSTLPRRSFGT